MSDAGVPYFCSMAKQRKDWLPILLMSVSLALLLISQLVWLQRTYRIEKAQFVKRSGELLEMTIREMYDVLTINRLREEVGDIDSCRVQIHLRDEPSAAMLNHSTKFLKEWESQSGKPFHRLPSDSIPSFSSDSTQVIVITQVRDFLTDTGVRDSGVVKAAGPPPLKQLFAQTDRAPMGMQLLFGLAGDSLALDSVRPAYLDKLNREGFTLPVRLVEVKDSVGLSGLSTPAITVNMFASQQFQAMFPTYRAFLLGRMWEEISFSVLLFGLIALAFALIYRSLLKQHRLSLMKNDLLSNITHELKTPISSVSVAIEALRDFGALQDPELTREYLDISRDELKRLSLLVDRVLRLTTFEQKEPELHFEPLDMAEMSQTILRTMQVQFDQYEAQHHLTLVGKDFTFRGDRIHLSSVLFNLLDNALKYRNGNRPEVELRVEEKDGDLTISVKDNGLGIPPAYQDRIFEKFFRVPQGNVHNAKGYGLGLSYVAAVVAKHGGNVAVESNPGVGSRFSLRFPKNG